MNFPNVTILLNSLGKKNARKVEMRYPVHESFKARLREEGIPILKLKNNGRC